MTERILPIQCIVPPHMLREIAGRGDAGQRRWALDTLALSERLRGRREAMGPLPAGVSVGEKQRSIFDARGGSTLPGTLARSEGEPPSSDPAVNEAYDGAGTTYDFYREAYGRNSLDDRGMRLDGSVHYGRDYDNAFWDGRQMVYGDGDGRLFRRFTVAVDVIGHELTHGVIQQEANFRYEDQPGALNESFADVFGSLVKQWGLGESADKADWLIGSNLFEPGVHGKALRSMASPGTAYDDPVLGTDPQPAEMKDYRKVDFDNGGVHINSGIPNHAFYLAATAIGGRAWETAGKVWYIALRDRLRSGADFRRAAEATAAVAAELFGAKSREQDAVRSAWDRVGVGVGVGAAR